MRRRAIGLLIVGAAAFACTRFGSSQDTTNPPPSTDGGTDDVALVDGSFTDAAPIDFADATTAIDAGYDDFERDGGPTKGPLDFNQGSGNLGDQERTDCTGPGATMCSVSTTWRFQADANDGNGGSAHYLITSLLPQLRGLHFSFSMMLKTSDDDGEISQAQLATIELTNGRFIYFETNHGMFQIGDQYLDDQGNYQSSAEPLGSTDMDTWARYDLFIDFGAGAAQVLRNGVIYGTNRQIRKEIMVDPTLVHARLGLTYTDGNSQVQQLVDNVGLIEIP